jgi:hypothetical protein
MMSCLSMEERDEMTDFGDSLPLNSPHRPLFMLLPGLRCASAIWQPARQR